MVFKSWLKKNYKMEIKDCSTQELYGKLLEMVKGMAEKKESNKGKKKLYYISAEFLIGKLLSNNLINLGIYEEVKKDLESAGKKLSDLEEFEPEPSLGNGGLGRLAACFLDSIATLNLNGDGIGLNYHYGLFQQKFAKNMQKELPNPWISEQCWLTKTDVTYQVDFGNLSVTSRMYDLDITGYEGRTNKLHLFDVESVDERIVKKNSIQFNKENIKKNLTLFLYPDDSDDAGRMLRVYQQYFMVSNGARLILKEAKERGCKLHDLDQYVAIQINDTHPSMVIPELIRLLMAEGILMEEAVKIVTKTCAYTNHTILAEALEKWPLHYLQTVVPQLVPIIEALDMLVKERYSDEKVAIIDKNSLVHMAHMDIHFCHAVNGVAYLHTEILKNVELHAFYELYPQRFTNKTNGITFRRWLLHANPQLAQLISEKIGDGYKKDATQLAKLLDYTKDKPFLGRLLEVKQQQKNALADYIQETMGVKINPDSIYDVQVKRLHEYKRQQLNVLYLIHKYLEIKAGNLPDTPITAIFGAKAAPAYVIAKDIIHAILCLQDIIQHDPQVSPYLQVVMVENYNVSWGEKLFPAADISEQISLASKEASGTGNMKFMLNGAVTLGTEDGANVEIHKFVGDENIYVFGEDSDTVIARYERGDYNSKSYYKADKNLKQAVDFITGKEMLAVGDKTSLTRLKNELLNKDWFMTFPDFEDYIETKEKAFEDYKNRSVWAQKMLVNIGNAGFFSSDRTIAEYNADIWHL